MTRERTLPLLGTQARGLGRQPRGPRVIAVTGAKGGVGKTLLAVNLAVLLAREGRRVVLADLDPGCGNVDVHLRLARRLTLDDVARGACAPTDALVDGPFGLRVLASRSGSTALATADPAVLARTIAAVEAAAAGADVAILDTGAGIGPMAMLAAERADLVVALTTTEPSALTDAYAQCKLLHQRGLPLPRLVVNGARSRDEALRTAGRFATVCRRFLQADSALLGWLRRHPEVERSTREQRPLALTGTGAAIDELRALAAAAMSALPARVRSAATGDLQRTTG